GRKRGAPHASGLRRVHGVQGEVSAEPLPAALAGFVASVCGQGMNLDQGSISALSHEWRKGQSSSRWVAYRTVLGIMLRSPCFFFKLKFGLTG
ncbi:unnamed protein product, partial [Ectocarpus sp. 12 AP-2014]